MGTGRNIEEGNTLRVAQELAKRVLAGERRALSSVLSLVENDHPEGQEVLRLLYPHTGKAQIIGITGPAGAGKSTLVRCLVKDYCGHNKSVGVVAIDPTSPLSQGALLGDRIRMQELTLDGRVFIRSMATRGVLGGLALATNDVITAMDAAGKDIIIVETIGAGQDEVAIANAVHTTIVVAIPGTGDDIQAIKAGIMEIADIIVVNKADLPGAEVVAKQLKAFLSHGHSEDWELPVLSTVGTKETGIEEVIRMVDSHYCHLQESGALVKRQAQNARAQIIAIANKILLSKILEVPSGDSQLEQLAISVAQRKVDPHAAAKHLVESINS